jgi:hypothetical protein
MKGDRVEDQELVDRFYREIGKLIFNSPSVAISMRIRNPIAMLRDYFDAPDNLKGPEVSGRRFVKEFAHLCAWCGEDELKRFADRWGAKL